MLTIMASLTVGVVSSVLTYRLFLKQLAAQNQQAQVQRVATQESEDQVLAARVSNLPNGAASAGSGSLVSQIFSQLNTRFKQAIIDVDNGENEASGNGGNVEGYLNVFTDR